MILLNFVRNKIFNIKFGKLLKTITITNIDSLSGVEFEEFVANLFRYLGFKTSTTPTTGDNGIDIIATTHDTTIGIQAKLYYNHNISNSAVQEAYSGKHFYKCDMGMVITNWKFSKPAQNLAKQLNIVLLDREAIIKMIESTKKENITFLFEIITRTLNEEK